MPGKAKLWCEQTRPGERRLTLRRGFRETGPVEGTVLYYPRSPASIDGAYDYLERLARSKGLVIYFN